MFLLCFQNDFLSFFTSKFILFSHISLSYPLLYPSSRILVCESICWWSREGFQFYIWRSCRGCGLGELASSRVLFLREQVRDLRIQESLRELVVGVAAPSDLAGSFLVKMLHCGEGGNVEQVARTSKQIYRVCDCLSLSQLTCFYIQHAHIVHIFICLIFTCA